MWFLHKVHHRNSRQHFNTTLEGHFQQWKIEKYEKHSTKDQKGHCLQSKLKQGVEHRLVPPKLETRMSGGSDFSTVWYMSVKSHESATGINLRVTNKFFKSVGESHTEPCIAMTISASFPVTHPPWRLSSVQTGFCMVFPHCCTPSNRAVYIRWLIPWLTQWARSSFPLPRKVWL